MTKKSDRKLIYIDFVNKKFKFKKFNKNLSIITPNSLKEETTDILILFTIMKFGKIVLLLSVMNIANVLDQFIIKQLKLDQYINLKVSTSIFSPELEKVVSSANNSMLS